MTYKQLINEMIDISLNESDGAKVTNGELSKIGKVAKKAAVDMKKGKYQGSLLDDDVAYMEAFAKDAFSRNLKNVTKRMNSGETENREDVFKVVSSVIGKDRAQLLANGKY